MSPVLITKLPAIIGSFFVVGVILFLIIFRFNLILWLVHPANQKNLNNNAFENAEKAHERRYCGDHRPKSLLTGCSYVCENSSYVLVCLK